MLLTSRFILDWLEWQRSCHIPKQENWDHLIWKWDSLLHPNSYEIYSTSSWFSTTLCIKVKLLTSRFFQVWLEWQRSCPIPKRENWDHLIWMWDSFFILTPMRFIPLPNDSPLLYVSKSCFFYIVIHPGLIRMTKKLSYSQTGKLRSPDLKVG